MHRHDDTTAHLRAAGVSLLIELTDPVPRILHWGADLAGDADLGDGMGLTGAPAVLNNAPDAARAFTIWPTERDGWSGTPAQEGHAAGAATTPRPGLVDAHVSRDEAGGRSGPHPDARRGDATRAWADLYRELRPLVHSGRVVNADLDDDATQLTGIVAQDGSRALFTWARLASSADGQVGRIPFPGLDASARYGIRIRTEVGQTKRRDVAPPEWVRRALEEEIVLPGAVLATAGVPLPTLDPQQAMLFDVRRVD